MISNQYTVYVFLLDEYRGKKLHPNLPILKVGYTNGIRPFKRLETNFRRESPNSYFDLFGKIECIYSKTFESLKEAKLFEKEVLTKLAKKDLYIEEKISGITELRVAMDWRLNLLSEIFKQIEL